MYRSLLNAILERGHTKAYPHGIRYLRKLDTLALAVSDWRGYGHHQALKEQVIAAHGRQRSFWSRYEGKG